MTTARLRAAAFETLRMPAHPVLPTERLLASERSAAGLDARRPRERPSVRALAELVDEAGAAALATAPLRFLIEHGWQDTRYARPVLIALADALRRRRRSLDRAVVAAYLHQAPAGHPGREVLREAATLAASRHGWPSPDVSANAGIRDRRSIV